MRPKTILVVDDDADIRLTIGQVLREEGYEVLEASDGLDALEVLKTTRPSLILLDLMMPRLDGYGFREHQDQDPAIATIPVVAVTAHRGAVAKLKPIEVLLKPLNLEQLLDTVYQYV